MDNLPQFIEILKEVELVVGQASKLTLPPIQTRSPLKEIRINADPLIEAQIAFDLYDQTISYNGEGIGQLTSHK